MRPISTPLAAGPHQGQRPLSLAEVEPVVPRDQGEDKFVALTAALAMDPHTVAVLHRGASPERQVRLAEWLEEREQRRRVLDGTVEPVDPQVLVVADQVRLVMCEDPAIAGRCHDLGIDDVGEAFEDRPLLGTRARGRIRAGLGEKRAGALRSAGLDLGRVVVAHETDEVVLVGLRLADRVGAGHAGGSPSVVARRAARASR